MAARVPLTRRQANDAAPHFVYELIDTYGDALYVGMSRALGNRLTQHATAHWWADVRDVRCHWYPDKRTARAAEAILIQDRQPPYNWNHTEQAAGSRSGGGHGYVAFRKSDVVDH